MGTVTTETATVTTTVATRIDLPAGDWFIYHDTSLQPGDPNRWPIQARWIEVTDPGDGAGPRRVVVHGYRLWEQSREPSQDHGWRDARLDLFPDAVRALLPPRYALVPLNSAESAAR